MSVKVVIADDSKFIQKSISDILIKNKFIEIVGYAANGKEAISIVEKKHPDVLLLDLLMPEMNGLDAFEKIMNNSPLPIIILSSLSPHTMDVSVQALLMGAFDYIIKPGGLGAKKIPKFQEELVLKVISASKSQIKKIFDEKNLIQRKKFLRQDYIDETFKFGRYINELRPIQDNYEIKKKPKNIGETYIHSNSKTITKRSNIRNQNNKISANKSYDQRNIKAQLMF